VVVTRTSRPGVTWRCMEYRYCTGSPGSGCIDVQPTSDTITQAAMTAFTRSNVRLASCRAVPLRVHEPYETPHNKLKTECCDLRAELESSIPEHDAADELEDHAGSNQGYENEDGSQGGIGYRSQNQNDQADIGREPHDFGHIPVI